jgi:hypothetical protein
VYLELARRYFDIYLETSADESVQIDKIKRAEALENFIACVQKISPASQISLIGELVQSANTSKELKLLEGLLDNVPPSVYVPTQPTIHTIEAINAIWK